MKNKLQTWSKTSAGKITWTIITLVVLATILELVRSMFEAGHVAFALILLVLLAITIVNVVSKFIKKS